MAVGGWRLVVGCGCGALPCEALERRGLRVDAERHAGRLQLLRYEFVDLLCEFTSGIVEMVKIVMSLISF